MKKQRIFTVIVVSLLALLLSSVPVQAQAVKIEFSGEMCRTQRVDPGKRWTTPGGVAHGRDIETNWAVDSAEDLVAGDMHRFMNANWLDRVGPFWGTFSLVLTSDPLSSWEGTYTGYRYEDGLMYSRWVGHGRGDIEGLKIKFYVTKPAEVLPDCEEMTPLTLTGDILDPHGEFGE